MLSVRPVFASTDPAMRGNHVIYHHGEFNSCPGCGRSNWYVGRLTAECAFCATALQLREASITEQPVIFRRGRPGSVSSAKPYSGIIRRGIGNRGLR